MCRHIQLTYIIHIIFKPNPYRFRIFPALFRIHSNYLRNTLNASTDCTQFECSKIMRICIIFKLLVQHMNEF